MPARHVPPPSLPACAPSRLQDYDDLAPKSGPPPPPSPAPTAHLVGQEAVRDVLAAVLGGRLQRLVGVAAGTRAAGWKAVRQAGRCVLSLSRAPPYTAASWRRLACASCATGAPRQQGGPAQHARRQPHAAGSRCRRPVAAPRHPAAASPPRLTAACGALRSARAGPACSHRSHPQSARARARAGSDCREGGGQGERAGWW